MNYVKAFGAGFVSTLVFHQGVLGVLYAAGVAGQAPYRMAPTWPLHVPAVVSLALWGGLWGPVLWAALSRTRTRGQYWLLALIVGAIGPSLIAWFVVQPLKGQPIAGGWTASGILLPFAVNAAWGVGVAVLMLLLAPRSAPTQ